jgi:LPXTG-site transpeptidase (sortase) family protein
MKWLTHRNLNNILSLGVVVFALYIAAFPYLPAFRYKVSPPAALAPYSGVLRASVRPSPESTPSPLPLGNRIVIPTAQVDLPILEGSGVSAIDNGGSLRKNLWVDSPLDSGNTVIVAHRFWYSHPTGGFYFLDRVKVGDKLAVYWHGEELVYEVVETKTVPNTAVEIEGNTPDLS